MLNKCINYSGRLRLYLNPINRLGIRRYSVLFPLLSTLAGCLLIEMWALFLMKNPNSVGAPAILVLVAMIIYFSFRDGIRGGFIALTLTIAYYFYIIYSRHYSGEKFFSAVDTTFLLGFVYAFLALIIGWLKETIDRLLEQESDERKRLQTIIQQIPVGVIITDKHGRIIEANKQVNKILGMAVPIGFVVGENLLMKAKKNGKYIRSSQSPLSQTLATGKPVVNKHFTIERDGKQVYLQVNAAAIHNKAGKIIAAASIISDVTLQKEMEERKDDFVNMASHELKTPITSMKLFINSLMRQIKLSGDEKSEKILNNISRQASKLQDLVNDLLDVSRLQTGKLAFTKEQFILNDLINETVESLKGATRNQKLTFKEEKEIRVFGDRFRIYQVISNFITNAIKYSPEGTEIIIRVKMEKKKIVVSVQDFGMGIDKTQFKKIFDRLYQVTDSKEKTFPGLGMGLYISREIILRHKGYIWVESEKGKGSTFYFSLPQTVKKS